MDPFAALQEAARDARYLLERGYPREAVLKLTGDRYRLNLRLRNMVRRGAFGSSEAAGRKARLLGWDDLQGQALGIDGHNVLITLETAIRRGVLVMADDGCVRDIAEWGRNRSPGTHTGEAARLLLEALQEAALGRVVIYLDAPLPKSGELAKKLRELMRRAGLQGDALAVPVPERYLKEHHGPVASSDSALLDAAASPVDLAGLIITRKFEPGATVRF